MFSMEKELIYEINCGNMEGALKAYEKLFNSIEEDGNICSIKNYIICLNGVLYKNAYENLLCKKFIYEKRNCLIREIEKQNTIKQLYKLGEEVISFYVNSIEKKCICLGNPIVRKALDYIHSHLEEDLTLERVADAIHVSKNHLSSLFPKFTGYNFSNYVNEIRIEKGKMLLKNSNDNILEIAIQCGFNSQSYFCFTFKKFTGVSPSQYRKEN